MALAGLEKIYSQLQGKYRLLESDYQLLKMENQQLKAKLADLLRRLFGEKSEKMDPAQLQLLLEGMEADEALETQEPPAPPKIAEPKPLVRRGGGRRPLPENLPVEQVVIEVPESERVGMVKMREEITEEIDDRPSQFIRRRTVRPVYASAGKDVAPVQAPAPKRVIPGSGVGTGLIAYVLVSRFCDHLPYYRLEQMAARQGVTLDRQRLGAWAEHAALLLKTIWLQLKAACLYSNYLQIDETMVRVMDPERPKVPRPSWLWVYHAPKANCVVFDFNLSRGQSSLDGFFTPEWSGVVQTDGYSVYPAFLKAHTHVELIGCWAHVRRAWLNAIDNGGKPVAQIIAEIQKLYRIEEQIKNCSPEERAQVRQAQSLLPLATINTLSKEVLATALPASAVGKAAAYTLNRWAQLEGYAQPGHGHIHIDNNPVERDLRPTALGKKNWLFIGHPAAGWRSAVIYSVLGSCRLVGANPFDYLVWALNQLASATSTNVGALLPSDYLAAVNATAVKEQL